jgi:putative transcriptional regulator
MSKTMYHYTSCGLSNVWLKDGYEWRETKHGKALAIHDVQGLHKAIAMDIVEHSPAMNGDEFRFLRTELGMSQRALGSLMDRTEQAVAMWEKSKEPVQRTADMFLRALYKSTIAEEQNFAEMVARINELDRAITEREICMSEENGEWRMCA